MKTVYLVLKGYNNHDCQPNPLKCFSTLEKAILYAESLEELEENQGGPGYNTVWRRGFNESYPVYYSQSTDVYQSEHLPKHHNEFPGEVICIQELPLDEN